MSDENDIDRWLAQLSGREPTEPDSDAARLRAILLEDEAQLHRQIEQTHASEDQAILRLRHSLERERFRKKGALRRFGLPAALAASVLIAGALYVQRFRDAPDPHVLYGDKANAGRSLFEVQISAADPREAAESLHDELGQAGLFSHISWDEDHYYLEVEVTSNQPPVVGTTWLEGGIHLNTGLNRIEISMQ